MLRHACDLTISSTIFLHVVQEYLVMSKLNKTVEGRILFFMCCDALFHFRSWPFSVEWKCMSGMMWAFYKLVLMSQDLNLNFVVAFLI